MRVILVGNQPFEAPVPNGVTAGITRTGTSNHFLFTTCSISFFEVKFGLWYALSKRTINDIIRASRNQFIAYERMAFVQAQN